MTLQSYNADKGLVKEAYTDDFAAKDVVEVWSGEEVTAQAQPAEGEEFYAWMQNGKIVSTSNDITKATYRLARGMCKKDSSFVTIISGCDVSDEDAEKVTEIVKAKCPNHVEVSHIRGGQPVYYYMISVE